MRIRLRMVGAGTPADPFRVPCPTFVALRYDYLRGVVVVDVPDADAPSGPGVAGRATSLELTPAADAALRGGDVPAVLPPGVVVPPLVPRPLPPPTQADWHARLDERYQEHTGGFRPEAR